MMYYNVITHNYNNQRTTSKEFASEQEAITYCRLQMRRKLGKDYKSIIQTSKGRVYGGYTDGKSYEFCISKYSYSGNSGKIGYPNVEFTI